MNSPSKTNDLEVSCADVKAKLDAEESFVLLDCRETDEFRLVHIERAQLFPMSELGQRAEELEGFRNDEIVVYCHHGARSLQVTMWLRQNGFSNVRSMAGGIDRWAVEVEPGMRRY